MQPPCAETKTGVEAAGDPALQDIALRNPTFRDAAPGTPAALLTTSPSCGPCLLLLLTNLPISASTATGDPLMKIN